MANFGVLLAVFIVLVVIIAIAVIAWLWLRRDPNIVPNGNGTNGGGGGGTTIPDVFAREYDAFFVKLGIVKRKIGEIAVINTGFPASCRTPFHEFILDIPEIETSFGRVVTEGTKPISEIFKNKTADLLKATDFFDLGVRNTTEDLEDGLSNIDPISNPTCYSYVGNSNLEPAWRDFVKDVGSMSADVVRLSELSNL